MTGPGFAGFACSVSDGVGASVVDVSKVKALISLFSSADDSTDVRGITPKSIRFSLLSDRAGNPRTAAAARSPVIVMGEREAGKSAQEWPVILTRASTASVRE